MTTAEINKTNKKLTEKGYSLKVAKYSGKLVVQYTDISQTNKMIEDRLFLQSVIANSTSFNDIYYSL